MKIVNSPHFLNRVGPIFRSGCLVETRVAVRLLKFVVASIQVFSLNVKVMKQTVNDLGTRSTDIEKWMYCARDRPSSALSHQNVFTALKHSFGSIIPRGYPDVSVELIPKISYPSSRIPGSIL